MLPLASVFHSSSIYHRQASERLMNIFLALFFCVFVGSAPGVLADTKPLTPLEANDYQKLPKTARITAFFNGLAHASPYAKTLWLGRSAGGREITGLLVSKEAAFLDEAVTAEGKLTVMLIGSQHGTEPSGAEALQEFAVELLQGDLHPYLNSMDFIVVPNSNPDGRDLRRRVNANEVNLSTDYVVLSQPESRGIVAALTRFEPHVLLDVHESAILKAKSLGAQGYLTDFEAQFEIANHPNIDAHLRTFSLEIFLPQLLKAINAQGLPAGRYISEITDINQPIKHGGMTLRNLRNYAGFRGTLSMLVENRLDPPGDYPTWRNIKVRVAKQLLSIVTFLRQVQVLRKEILGRVKSARNSGMKASSGSSLKLVSRYVPHPSQSKITLPLRKRDTGERIDHVFDYHGQVMTESPFTRPAGYAVTARHEFVAELLDRHQIHYALILEGKQTQGIRQRVKKIEITPSGSDKRRSKVAVSVEEDRASISLVPGDLWIDLDQPAGGLIPLIFDPRSTTNLFQNPAYTLWLSKGKYFFMVPVTVENALVDPR